MSNYHVIIHREWGDISGGVAEVFAKLEKYAVAEHPIEGKATRIHCHSLAYGVPVKTEALRRKFGKQLPGINGNDRIILDYYEDRQGVKHKVDDKGLIYILKGDRNRLKYYKGFTEEQIEEAVRAWKNFPSNETAKSSVNKEKPKDLSGNKTDWMIIQDMVADIQALPVLDVILNYDEQGNVVNLKKWSQAQICSIISKHLNINKKKTSVHDAQRWLGTVLRILEGHREDFWKTVWERFSKHTV